MTVAKIFKKKDNLIIASWVLAIPAICVVSYKILPSVMLTFRDLIRDLIKDLIKNLSKNKNTTIVSNNDVSDNVTAAFRPPPPPQTPTFNV